MPTESQQLSATPANFRVFISYAPSDTWVPDFVHQLQLRLDATTAKTLKRVVLWTDTKPVLPGKPSAIKAYRAITESQATILIVTPEYLKNGLCRWQRHQIGNMVTDSAVSKHIVLSVATTEFNVSDWPIGLRQLPTLRITEELISSAGYTAGNPKLMEGVDWLAGVIASNLSNTATAQSIESMNPIRIRATSIKSHPLADSTPPEWASEWGHDEYGPWCGFQIVDVRQVLRWIPAGTFQMGVAEEFEGLFDEDGPRNWVTLSRGFWMFEALCSLRLFNAVINGTAQAVASDDGSAVNLQYWTARNFCGKLSEILRGVTVTLPTDAQWEFACRAGRQEASEELNPQESETHLNPWGLRDMLSGVAEFCWDGPREYSAESVTDPVGSDKGVVVRGVPRRIPNRAFRGWAFRSRAMQSSLPYSTHAHPSFREIVDVDVSIANAGFRCVIPQDGWIPASTQRQPRTEETTEEHTLASTEAAEVTVGDLGEPVTVELDDTPLSFRLKDMASHLHRYYTELSEPVPGIETRWQLIDGNPLCEAGRTVVHSIPDSVPDSKGTPNFPDRGGRLWYLLLRTSRRAQFEDARPYLIAAARDLVVWLSDQYPRELPPPIVVADIPLSVRLENLRTFLSVQMTSAQQKLGTGTAWFAQQPPLFNAVVEVLVAIPDAITAPDGTPNFPGVGSHLWPQLKNSLMTTEDSPKQAKRRSELAEQFRDWLTNRYRTDSLEATGIQAAAAFDKPTTSAENSIESTGKQFDVYLSYNAIDREAIEPLILEFKRRGLTVFLDTEQLSSGGDLNAVLQHAIRNSRCVVVCVSKTGLGRWQRAEIDAYMRQLPDIERGQFFEHTILVLLPGAPDPHDKPASWNAHLWLDIRSGLGEAELEQLVSVIGKKIEPDRHIQT